MADDPVANRRPPPRAVEEAKKNPGGWVYEIRGVSDPDGDVPADAIVGAWKVDDQGQIMGNFIPNPNFVAKKRDTDKG